MTEEKILSALKELIKIQNSIRTFDIAQAQILKTISLDIGQIRRDFLKLREVKDDDNRGS